MALDLQRGADTLLVELDRSLRSGRIGDQCEAIVRLPSLFDASPFPTLINAAFLKLAEVFRNGSNFLRLCVLKVVQQSTAHLEKVQSVDEVVRRISATCHSNDPIARALALRVLGTCATLTSHRTAVQQRVRQALDARDSAELDAAVFAARCLASRNDQFAASLVDRLSGVICGLSTPLAVQLRLLPVLQYVRTRQQLDQARQLCVQLVERHSAHAQVVKAVQVLTQLALADVIFLREQVVWLIGMLNQEPRRGVRLAILAALDRLACQSAHLWPVEVITKLWSHVTEALSPSLAAAALIVLNSLAWSAIGGMAMLSDGAESICLSMCASVNGVVASLACGVITAASVDCVRRCEQVGVPAMCSQALGVLQSALIMVCSSIDACNHDQGELADESYDDLRGLKLLLSCCVRLATACPDLSGDLLAAVASAGCLVQERALLLICRALHQITSIRPVTFDSSLISPLLDSVFQTAARGKAEDNDLLVAVAMLFLANQTVDQDSLQCLITHLEDSGSYWPLYCVARASAQRGHFAIAVPLFERLQGFVSLEPFQYWLRGLSLVCQAEEAVKCDSSDCQELDEALGKSSCCHYKALTPLRLSQLRSGAASHRLRFAAEYCRLRGQSLHCLRQLLAIIRAVHSCPPQSVSSMNGQVAMQVDACVSGLCKTSAEYTQLLRSAFNADDSSLQLVRRLRSHCLLLADAAGACMLGRDFPAGVSEDKEVARARQTLREELAKQHVSTLKRTDCLLEVMKATGMQPQSLPTFIFHDQQGTSFEIAVWPRPSSSGQPLPLEAFTQLALRVEGVVRHAGRLTYRHVSTVHVDVTSELVSSSAPQRPTDEKVVARSSGSGCNLQQTLQLRSNSFAAEFLLDLQPDASACHRVHVAVSVSDESGIRWTTGPHTDLTVNIDPPAPSKLRD